MESNVPSKERNKVAVYVYIGMRVLVVLSIAAFVLFRDWLDAVNATLILGLMLLPSLLKHRYKLYLPFELDLAIVSFIFLSLFLGSLRNFYERFSLWDSILHFQSGILLGIVGFVMVYILNEKSPTKLVMSPIFISLFSVCFSLALAVVWEVYEYAADSWFGYTMQESGLPDTMGDLIVNGVGALIVAVVAFVWMKRRQRLPFAPKKFKKYILSE
ncbi:hypothetical protein GW943_00935 [Candidatus Parcubacteria bacterium]|uniref:DUF2238 domain-containing protein n=1 Tax=Candidatus Kaiserbacteria bacterium CG10_big_fil_rev_8_21_14_0_10_47_16 TaxID=1974608 RepID=A0A2H0UD96_9BACT|nr:hypothetical protein [Candidatus Parcubacteria bacterium]PIR84398.1 MAG: hypothetical protein COU16_02315 [Candidatus Kaiserbacteria bacterium CG10_big_fil_rev_8_21_14_0_10_47_16]